MINETFDCLRTQNAQGIIIPSCGTGLGNSFKTPLDPAASPPGPYVTWAPPTSAPPGYVGNPNVLHTMTGSPENPPTKFFCVEASLGCPAEPLPGCLAPVSFGKSTLGLGNGGTPDLVIDSLIPGGSSWQSTSTRYRYTNKTSASGITKVILKAGTAGRARISLGGKGAGHIIQREHLLSSRRRAVTSALHGSTTASHA